MQPATQQWHESGPGRLQSVACFLSVALPMSRHLDLLARRTLYVRNTACRLYGELVVGFPYATNGRRVALSDTDEVRTAKQVIPRSLTCKEHKV